MVHIFYCPIHKAAWAYAHDEPDQLTTQICYDCACYVCNTTNFAGTIYRQTARDQTVLFCNTCAHSDYVSKLLDYVQGFSVDFDEATILIELQEEEDRAIWEDVL